MQSITQVIERQHSNGTVTITITKERRKEDYRYKVDIHEENYTNSGTKAMYSDAYHSLHFYRKELLELRDIIEKALLFLES